MRIGTSGDEKGDDPVPPVSADCNENGIPDECEVDCNCNDIPDDCDIDGWMDGETPVGPVSYDCNENGIPDECDMSRAILTSFDCKMNGIPDECDIAGYMTGETPVPHEGACESSPSAEANAALCDWMAEQEWGPNASTTTAEQFAAFTAKCAELGLSVQSLLGAGGGD